MKIEPDFDSDFLPIHKYSLNITLEIFMKIATECLLLNFSPIISLRRWISYEVTVPEGFDNFLTNPITISLTIKRFENVSKSRRDDNPQCNYWNIIITLLRSTKYGPVLNKSVMGDSKKRVRREGSATVITGMIRDLDKTGYFHVESFLVPRSGHLMYMTMA